MKFCTKCGNELLDEAVVCMKCGCAVSNSAQGHTAISNHPKVSVDTSTAKRGKCLNVFNFVFDVSAILYMAMLWISVAYSYVWADIYTTRYSGYNISVNLYLEYGCIIIAFILSIVMLGFGITCFSVTLANRHREEKLFAGIKRLIAGACALVVGIMLLTTM